MSIYICCPTCNRLLADKIQIYEETLKKICDNPDLTPEQKDSEKLKLFEVLRIPKDRYCCRMRIMTHRDLVNIVK